MQEQEQKYGLIYCFYDMNNTQEQAIKKAIELISKENLKEKWVTKRQRMLAEKIEVTQFMIDLVEELHGVVTVLWHNIIFDWPYRRKWAEFYEWILQYSYEKGAWLTSAEEIYRWWIQNYSRQTACQ